MVVDDIRNAKLYKGLGEGIKAALEYLTVTDFVNMESGTHELPNGLHAIVTDYRTVPANKKHWEAHRKYIDVQFVVSGCELLGYAHSDLLKPVMNYDEPSDATMLDGPGDFFRLTPGTFAILYPQDAHKPGIAASDLGKDGIGVTSSSALHHESESEQIVRKVVVKVPV